MKKIKFLLLFFSFLISSPVLSESLPFHDPQIKYIRKLYERVQSDLKKKRFQVKKRHVEGCVDQTLHLDSKGNVPLYLVEEGTDDHFTTSRYYYDGESKLRFVFTSGGHVNGNSWEERIYLNETGEVILKLKKPKEFGAVGDSRMILDPKKDFKVDGPCGR